MQVPACLPNINWSKNLLDQNLLVSKRMLDQNFVEQNFSYPTFFKSQIQCPNLAYRLIEAYDLYPSLDPLIIGLALF